MQLFMLFIDSNTARFWSHSPIIRSSGTEYHRLHTQFLSSWWWVS